VTAGWRALLAGRGGAAAGLAMLTALTAITEGAGLLLLVPMLGALGADAAIMPGPAGRLIAALHLPRALEPLLAAFVMLVMIRAVLGAARDYAGHRFEAGIIDGLRHRAWAALVHCEWKTLAGLRQTDATSLIVSSVDRVSYGVNQLIALAASAATLGSIGLAAVAIAPQVAALALVGGAAVLLAYRGLRRRANALGTELGEAYQQVHARLIEGLGALRIIKSLGREEAAIADLDNAFARTRAARQRYVRDTGAARVAFQSGGAILLSLLVWLAIRRWHMGAAGVIPTVALFARALPLLGTVQEAWQNWAHVRPALDEALTLIETAEMAAEPLAGPDGARLAGFAPSPDMAVTGVTVRHAARGVAALEDVSAVFPFGSITALSGPSGAGKSTLADVLCGMIGPDAGALEVGGSAVTGGARRAWRKRVAYVQQEPVLFHASIRENLLWGRPGADDGALEAALRAASADFVLALPDGLDTVVGDRGARLSGGERQRIALARGLLRQPDLLILDEVTSALDAENEAAVAGAIARLRGTMTLLIIGHRGALAALADRRIALAGGRVVSSDMGPI